MQHIKIPARNAGDNDATLVINDTPPAPTRVEINLNDVAITAQIRKAQLPLSAKRLAARILTLCVKHNSGRMWINLEGLKTLRKSPLLKDAFSALGKLQRAKIIQWGREQREGGEVVIVEFTGWQ